jgi:hypothetical protein
LSSLSGAEATEGSVALGEEPLDALSLGCGCPLDEDGAAHGGEGPHH